MVYVTIIIIRVQLTHVLSGNLIYTSLEHWESSRQYIITPHMPCTKGVKQSVLSICQYVSSMMKSTHLLG